MGILPFYISPPTYNHPSFDSILIVPHPTLAQICGGII